MTEMTPKTDGAITSRSVAATRNDCVSHIQRVKEAKVLRKPSKNHTAAPQSNQIYPLDIPKATGN